MRQTRVPDELVGSERLLDVQESGVVEGAQRALVLGPHVRAVRIHGERDVGPHHPRSGGRDRDGIPPGRDLDLHALVPVPQRVRDPSGERVGLAVLGDAQRDAAHDPRRGNDAEALGHELRQPGAPAVRLQVPRRGLDSSPRERIPAHVLAQRGVHHLR